MQVTEEGVLPPREQPAIRSPAAEDMTGPTSLSCDIGSPRRRARVDLTSGSISRWCASPTVTTTEPAIQRWPAAPKAEPRMAPTVGSMTASGITTMWFLAPPRACTRLPAQYAD